MQLILAVTGLALITLAGLFAIVSPQTSYEWFVFKTGRDQLRNLSPERGRLLRWFHQCCGAVMLLGGLTMIAILILGINGFSPTMHGISFR